MEIFFFKKIMKIKTLYLDQRRYNNLYIYLSKIKITMLYSLVSEISIC